MKRILLLSLLLLFFSEGFSQARKRKPTQFNSGNRANPFLHQQWWIGLKGGVNVSDIHVKKTYSVLAPTNYDPAISHKVYETFKPVGTQLGLEATYYYHGFSASVQPTYQNTKFSYSNSYTWVDVESPSNRLDLTYNQEQQVAYLVVPLIFKYEFTFARFTPFVQVGSYLSFLLNANKDVSIKGTDYASGGVNEFSSPTVSIGATDLFAKQHYGYIAGAGLYYNIGNIRLSMDVQYKFGRSIINSDENRYQNDRLSGIGDSMDDMTINNISVSLGTLFPLRFLSSGFKSFDK
jgi:hypothetical protein